jgi:uncharacterized protein (TIGR02145 family)
VYDLDSNKYTVVKIGKQYWMQQNLRTTQYNDTSSIAHALSAADWKSATTGAYAVFEDNPAHDATYGKLYNGYAVATGKLCPKGWHIPSDKEWQEMEAVVGLPANELARTGGRGNQAGAIKSQKLWKESEIKSDNKTGLNVLPAGTRTDVGDYVTLNQFTGFWTSTTYETASNYLWYRHYYFNVQEMGRNYVIKNNGFSCRCIKDETKKKEPAKPSPQKPKTKYGTKVISNG